MHPDFLHQRKRFSLSFAVTCVSLLIDSGRSVAGVGRQYGVARHTLRRWVGGFAKQNTLRKRLCFFGSVVASDGEDFLKRLFGHIQAVGKSDLETGTALCMRKLAADFSCALY
jgi:hypothetical protein